MIEWLKLYAVSFLVGICATAIVALVNTLFSSHGINLSFVTSLLICTPLMGVGILSLVKEPKNVQSK